VLVELSKVEQRYDAVLAVIRDGLTITETAEAFGVSRQSIYRWMRRYEEGGIGSLAERSHRPKSCPHQLAPFSRPGWWSCASDTRGGVRSVSSINSDGKMPPLFPRTWPSIGLSSATD
jgi:hypothetical protein